MTSNNNIDLQVQKLFEIVQTKKAEIAKAEKPDWKTNCSFRWNENTTSATNIQTVLEPNILVSAGAKLLRLKESSEASAKKLGVENYRFEWFGYTTEEWFSDFQARITKIQISKKKAELADLENRLNSLVSPELKASLELAAISKALNI